MGKQKNFRKTKSPDAAQADMRAVAAEITRLESVHAALKTSPHATDPIVAKAITDVHASITNLVVVKQALDCP